MHWSKFLHILAVTCVMAGYSWWRSANQPQDALSSTTCIPATDIPLLSPTQAEGLWHKPSTLFVDVRSAVDFAYGHIAGAVSLPDGELAKGDALTPRLQKAGALIVYCKSVDCGKSLWAALRLRQQGFTQVNIFPAGWNEWYARRLPSHRTAER
jgi:rhodanese-related sulfurtransferase